MDSFKNKKIYQIFFNIFFLLVLPISVLAPMGTWIPLIVLALATLCTANGFKNITFDNSVFSLMGPNSRKILQGLTNTDLSNDNFPFATCKKIKIASKDVYAIRITYMGELGWELHFPIDFSS